MTEDDKVASTALILMGKRVRDFGGTMKVETYEITEPEPEPQIEAEAIELIDKLGLEGQKTLVKPETDVSEQIPYKELTKAEVVVFEAVFPKHDEVKQYAAGVMPVRVLQVAAHSIELFNKVQVWHREDSVADPVLMGINGTYSKEKHYLLARWGESVSKYETLLKEARESIKADYEKQIKACITKCNVKLQELDSIVEERLGGQTIYLPS
jgi:hypothetical protein